jgi:hypothetical protein
MPSVSAHPMGQAGILGVPEEFIDTSAGFKVNPPRT